VLWCAVLYVLCCGVLCCGVLCSVMPRMPRVGHAKGFGSKQLGHSFWDKGVTIGDIADRVRGNIEQVVSRV
jgi:hypothetical protein